MFREETRGSVYYYRPDHPKLVDPDWHVFTCSHYAPGSGTREMSKLPAHPLVA